METTIKLLLADDHLIIRDGIKLMLKKNSEFDIVAEASTGKEVIEYLANHPNTVDVVLMDINMPEMNGIEATQFITEHFKGINILALTMHIEEAYITSMLKAGALGYILKESGTNELISAIKSVASGQKYYSNDVSVTMINALMNDKKPESSVLSNRETEILGHIAMGSTNKEVGKMLFISGRTVETHRRNILGKLDLRNTAELIRYAIENKLIAC
ncbi:MAG: response regulator transcription factor [Flavobacteriales bacterium]|nr:response regulator transcription factor [Flavobacteriales bacterium]NQX96431.1 response regulator transcription factor [Flavobacteriales bacterium]